MGIAYRQSRPQIESIRDSALETHRLREPFFEDPYETGYDLGASWAQGAATWDEIREVTSYRGRSWFRLTFPSHHSLVDFVASELDCEEPGKKIRLRREPLTEGLLAGVSAVHDLIQSQGVGSQP